MIVPPGVLVPAEKARLVGPRPDGVSPREVRDLAGGRAQIMDAALDWAESLGPPQQDRGTPPGPPGRYADAGGLDAREEQPCPLCPECVGTRLEEPTSTVYTVSL